MISTTCTRAPESSCPTGVNAYHTVGGEVRLPYRRITPLRSSLLRELVSTLADTPTISICNSVKHRSPSRKNQITWAVQALPNMRMHSFRGHSEGGGGTLLLRLLTISALPNGNPILRSGTGRTNRSALQPICVAMKNTTDKKTAIITGASSGIGLGLTQRFLNAGFNVVANSRRITTAGTLVSSDDLLLVDGDIGEPATARDLVKRGEERFGRIDVLINNAGIFVPKPFDEYTPEDFRRVVSTNLAGFFFVSQEAARYMRRNGGGHIINISTTLAKQPVAGVNAALTSLTKGGLNSVTKGLAIEYAAEGIRVNAIAPGIVDTPMHRPQDHETLKHLHPIARLGRVQEIVDAALFLVNAPFVTGEVLHVDGGAHAGKW